MSMLSKFTGIGISRKGVKIDPKRAALTALTVAGGAGALGLVGKLGAGKVISSAMGHGGGPGEEISEDPSRFRQIGGFLKNNARTIADYGQMGEGIYDRYQQNQDRNAANREYANAAPLRAAAMQGLMDTSRPDLSGIFADEGNPQGRYRRVSVGSRGGY